MTAVRTSDEVMMPTPSTAGRDAQETLRRSLLMSNVQRAGIVGMVVAMISCVHWIGWAPMVALAAGVAAFVVMKLDAVRRRLGVWSLVLAWGLGQAATFTAVVVARGPTEYVVGMLAIPTILASVVWPPFYVRIGAVLTAVLVVLAGVVTDGAGVLERYPAFLIPAVMIAAVTWLSISARQAEEDSQTQLMTDALTGLPNRFALAAERRAIDGARGGVAAAVLVIDIDHFKHVNDTAGHVRGDALLRHTADVLNRALGGRGCLVRYGGEEFVAVLRDRDALGAAVIAEELRARIAASPDGGDTLTVSIGVARTDDRHTTFAELFDAADGALYRAKAGGRNRVVAADDPVGPDEAVRDRRADPTRSATHSMPPPAVVVGGRTPGERPPDRGPVLHDVLERSHLIHMTRRLRERNTLPIVAVYLAVIASIPRIGWTIIPLALMGSLAHRRAQNRVETVRNPLRTVGAGWLLTQVGIVAGLPWMHDDAVWLICLLVSMIITASAAFPLRYTVAGVATTAVLMVGGALLIDVRVLERAPQAVAINLAFLAACAIAGRGVGMLAARMRAESNHDELTGLPNRAAMTASGTVLVTDADDRGAPLGVVVADIDHFKVVNDRLGHAEGDRALAAVASTMREALRTDTMLFRVGGEEFAVIVPDADADAAHGVAERLRMAIERARDLPGGPLTVSLGVASRLPGTEVTLMDLLEQADLAMYRSKRAGRNRTSVAVGG